MTVYRSSVRLNVEGASEFLRAMGQAQSAVDSFQKAASKNVKFDMSSAGSAAATSFTRAFDSGLSPLQTIAQGALLKVGSLITSGVVKAFAEAGQQASESFSRALNFEQAIANVASLADGGTAASDAIGRAVQSVAVDPKLIVNTQEAAKTFEFLEKTGASTADSINGLLRQTILLQNAGGSAAGGLTEFGLSADLVGRGIKIFNADVSESGDLIDAYTAILTGSAIKDLNDLRYLLVNSGTAVQTLGLSFDELAASTISTSGAFSSGRTQGTALEGFIAGLAHMSDDARLAMQTLGIQAFTAQGQFVGIAEVQRQLQEVTESGTFTQEAYLNLLARAFGQVGSDYAVALANGENFGVAMQRVGETSAAAIAGIKTDTALQALGNLGDIAGDLSRRLSQPLVEQLSPAIFAAANLLNSLAGTFDFLGQRIAASLTPVINFVTQQFNTLAQTIAAVTGASISLPSLGASAGSAAQGYITGATRPITANSDASAAGRAQGEQNRVQQQIGIDQLNAAKGLSGGAKSLSAAMSALDSILSSSVTALDKGLAEEGKYMNKPDEKLRQLRAFIKNGSEEFAGVADDYRLALQRIGVTPAEDLETFLLQVEELQASKAIFADPANIALLIDTEAVKREVEMKELAQKGADNIAKALGSYVEGLTAGAAGGFAGGGGVAATPIATPELPAATEAQQQQLFNLYNKNIEDVQTAGIEQQNAVSGLVSQVTEMKSQFDIVTGLFGGFNAVLGGFAATIQGGDFASAGLIFGSAVSAVANGMTQLVNDIDVETATGNLSTFVQGVLAGAAAFVGSIDGEAVGSDVATFASSVVGRLADGIKAVPLEEIAVAASNLVGALGAQFKAAFSAENTATVGQSIGEFVTTIVGKLTETLGNPDFGTQLASGFADLLSGIVGGMTGLFTGATEGMSEIDTTAVGSAINTFLSSFVTELSTKLEEIPVAELATAVRDFLSQAVTQAAEIGSQVDTESAAGSLADSFYTLVENALAGVFAGLPGGEAIAGFVKERQAQRDRLLAEAAEANAAVNAAGEEAAAAGSGFFAQQQARWDAEMAQFDADSEESFNAFVGFFQPITDALNTGLKNAFAPDAIYTADIGSGIGGAGLSLSGDISTAFAQDALYPPELAGGFTSIAQSISGAFTSIYDAIAGFFSNLTSLLPSWPGSKSSTATPETEKPTPGQDTGGLAWLGDMIGNWIGGGNTQQGPQPFDPATYAAANNFDGTTEIAVRETSAEQVKTLEDLKKEVVRNTNVYSASGTTDQSGGLINPETAAQLGVLSTTIPNAGSGFISTLTGATTSTGDFIGPMDEATAAAQGLADVTNDQITAVDKVAGSFNTLLDKSDKAATNLGNLNDALGDQNISQSLDAFVSAVEDAVNGMNKALDKLGTEAPPPTETTPATGPRGFARGTRYYPGGRSLGGEEGEELYITPHGLAGLLGRGGPELFTAPIGTAIFPADVTRSLLGRGIPYLDPGVGGGSTPSSPSSVLLDSLPIPLPPVTIPQGPDSEVTRDEPTATATTKGISSDLLAHFLQGLDQTGVAIPGLNPGKLAQQINSAAGSAKTTAQQIAELFTKPLFGGRYAAPQTQIINVSIKDSHDNVTNQTVHNYGGLNVKSMRSTENLARDFRLLQAISG